MLTGWGRASRLAALTLILPSAAVFIVAPPALAAQGPVGLGTADTFAVLAGSGITNAGITTITGDVGTFPTMSETGFGSIRLNGTDHGGDAVTQGAKNDLAAAYMDAVGRKPVTNVAGELGGSTLLAGVYASPSFGLAGTLTLDAKGSPDAEFIFQAGSTVIAESNSRVLLLNGADPCHVIWQVGSSATFQTGARFVGDVLAHASITAQTGATFQGRLLARDGAVTLDTNTITKANCVPPAAPSGTTPTTGGRASTAIGSVPTGRAASAPGATPSAPPNPILPRANVGSPAGTTGMDSGPPRWTLSAPRETPSSPSTPLFLAVIGAPLEALMRTALALLALGAVGFVAFVAFVVGRRRRATHTA